MFALTCGRGAFERDAQVRDVQLGLLNVARDEGRQRGRAGLCGHSLKRWREGQAEGRGGSGPSGRVISGRSSQGGHRCW